MAAFINLRAPCSLASKLRSNNKHWRESECKCHCWTSSFNIHGSHNWTFLKCFFFFFLVTEIYHHGQCGCLCEFILPGCVRLKQDYCNINLLNYSSLVVEFYHYMCLIQVRLAVLEKGMCLAVKAKAVTHQRDYMHSHLTSFSMFHSPSEPK